MRLSKRGGIIAMLLAILWLAFFFVLMVAIFAYIAGYARVEIGPSHAVKRDAYDEHTIANLERREEEVAERSKELARKEEELTEILNQLHVEKQEVAEDRAAISANLVEIKNFFEKFSTEEEKNLKQLAKMYEAMKPKKVANIFNQLEQETVAELLRRMKSRSSAKVLAEIGQQNAHRAAEISDIIQGKNKQDAFNQTVQ